MVLPRLSDLVHDILSLLSTKSADQEVEVFILDFTDAFWQIPLATEERRHFVGFDGDRLWMFRRAAQGSRNGPLAWAGPSSLLLRCTQAVLSGMSQQPDKPDARSQLYVDDPAIAIRGTPAFRDDTIATAVLVWRLLGFKLAFHKAQRGTDVVWIGGRLKISEDKVVVSIPESKLQEFLSIVDELLLSNVAAIRKVRTLAGKASHFASMVYIWRPFLSEIWAAIQEASNPTNARNGPKGCVWLKQIRPALLWFKAFLQGRAGALQITYLVSAFKNSGRKLRIVGDACVFGLGAYLMDESQIVSWYAVALTEKDERWLGIKVGDESSQQVAESLNLLVALRVWKHHWQSERIKLEVRSDNVAALHLVLRLKGKSPGMNQVARELALDLGDAAFRPDIVTHTPGVASEIADALSRRHQPGVSFVCLLACVAFQRLFRMRELKIGGRQLLSAEAYWQDGLSINSGSCVVFLLCLSRLFGVVSQFPHVSGLLGSTLLFQVSAGLPGLWQDQFVILSL